MRYALLALLSLALFSCSEEATPYENTTQTAEEKNEIYDAFVNDLEALEDFEGNPVPEFKVYADKNAALKEELHKSNAAEAFEKAKQYKNVFIVLDDHTVAKIVDHEQTQASGSWGIELPMAEGYIRNGGKINYENNYINYIVGTPDHGNQTIYYFNE